MSRALTRADELVGELLDGGVADLHPGLVAADVVADGVEQVGLAEARPAVDEERVVGVAGLLGHGQRRGVGEAVAAADDELLEGVLGDQGPLSAGAAPPDRALTVDPVPSPRRTTSTVASGAEAAPRLRPGAGPRSGHGPSADVVRRAHETAVSRTAGESQRLEPDVEGEVGHVGAKLFADAVPDRLQLFALRQQRPLPEGWFDDDWVGEGERRPAWPCPLKWASLHLPGARRRPLGVLAEDSAKRGECPRGPGRRPPRPPERACLYCPAALRTRTLDEAHLPAKEAQARPHARLPCAHEHEAGRHVLRRRRSKGRARLTP